MTPINKGKLYIISAPSGAGKTSLVKQLIAQRQDTIISVSHTTRTPRPNEEDGVDYHFVDEAEFKALIQQQAFFEYAKVFDHYYATSKEWVLSQLDSGRNVILEIDWQGAEQVRAKISNTINIFILPPSEEVLRERLTQRGDKPEVIERRMRDASSEMSHSNAYDHIIVNDDFNVALEELNMLFNQH